MSNINLIDDYLANRMGDTERAAFESRLASEPELKQEFTFHKEIVNSIHEERKAELKSMLDTIPVSSAPTSPFGTSFKIAATLFVTAALIGTLYFFTSNDNKEVNQKEVSTVEPVISNNDTEIVEKEAVVTDSSPVNEETPATSSEQKVEARESDIVTQKPDIQSPNLVDDFETDENATDISVPEVYTESADVSREQLFNSTIEVVTDNSKKKFKFHYQFKEDKLYLYGAFDKGLYEILEFNSKDGKTIILYYKENYYLIDNNQKDITPLKAIEDLSMIEKLNLLRK